MLRALDGWIYRYVTEELDHRKNAVKIFHRHEIQARTENDIETEGLLPENKQQEERKNSPEDIFPTYPRITLIQSVWTIFWNIPQIALIIRFYLWMGNRTAPDCVVMVNCTYYTYLIYMLCLIIATSLFLVLEYSQTLHKTPQLKLKINRVYVIANTVSSLCLVLLGLFIIITPHVDHCLDSHVDNSKNHVSTQDFYINILLPLLVVDFKFFVAVLIHFLLPQLMIVINFQTLRIKVN
jgi:hypothetical protein